MADQASEIGGDMMSPAADNVLQKLESLTETELKETVPGLITKIRSLPLDDQRQLLSSVLASRTSEAVPGTDWNRSRTLVGVVLHSVGVRTIEGPEERKIRAELQRDLAATNGATNGHPPEEWISLEELLKAKGFQDDEVNKE